MSIIHGHPSLAQAFSIGSIPVYLGAPDIAALLPGPVIDHERDVEEAGWGTAFAMKTIPWVSAMLQGLPLCPLSQARRNHQRCRFAASGAGGAHGTHLEQSHTV